jgi:hypothetical protein
MILRTNQLNGWLNVPATLSVPGTKNGDLEGNVKFGTKNPEAPRGTPLTERRPHFLLRLRKETSYYFVSTDNAVKIKLPLTRMETVNENSIRGRDKQKLQYTITKQ